MARVGENSRIGIENAIDIFPHRHTLSVQDISHTRCRVVRTFATECRGLTRWSRADKSLTNKQFRTLARYGLTQWSGRSVEVDTCVLMAFVGNDTATHIDPTARHARHVQELGNDRGREQLSIAHNAVVPHLGILDLDLSLRGDLFQFGKQLIDRLQTVGRA